MCATVMLRLTIGLLPDLGNANTYRPCLDRDSDPSLSFCDVVQLDLQTDSLAFQCIPVFPFFVLKIRQTCVLLIVMHAG